MSLPTNSAMRKVNELVKRYLSHSRLNTHDTTPHTAPHTARHDIAHDTTRHDTAHDTTRTHARTQLYLTTLPCVSCRLFGCACAELGW